MLVVPCASITKLNDDHKYWAEMEMLGIMKEVKNMVFQAQYAQGFPQRLLYNIHEYNFQSHNISAVSNIPNNRTVNSSTVSDELSNHSSEF